MAENWGQKRKGQKKKSTSMFEVRGIIGFTGLWKGKIKRKIHDSSQDAQRTRRPYSGKGKIIDQELRRSEKIYRNIEGKRSKMGCSTTKPNEE